MTEAWMKRGSERQEFLDNLKRAIYDEEEEYRKRMGMQIPFAVVILNHLGNNLERLDLPILVMAKANDFFEGILKEIKAFARTPQEELALIADLLEWEVASIATYFRQPLQVQETIEPEKVFEGRRAMDRAD